MFCHKCGARVDDQAAFCDKCGASLQRPLPGADAPPPAPGYAPAAWPARVEYAGFWRRLAAAIIDALIMAGVQIAVIYVLRATNVISFDSFEVGTAEYNRAMLNIYLVACVLLPLEILFFAILEASPWQATPGKMVVGARVTDLDGNRLSLGRAVLRVALKLFPGIVTLAASVAVYALSSEPEGLDGLISVVSVVLLLLYLVIPFSQKKQGLHDMVAGTLVVARV